MFSLKARPFIFLRCMYKLCWFQMSVVFYQYINQKLLVSVFIQLKWDYEPIRRCLLSENISIVITLWYSLLFNIFRFYIIRSALFKEFFDMSYCRYSKCGLELYFPLIALSAIFISTRNLVFSFSLYHKIYFVCTCFLNNLVFLSIYVEGQGQSYRVILFFHNKIWLQTKCFPAIFFLLGFQKYQFWSYLIYHFMEIFIKDLSKTFATKLLFYVRCSYFFTQN